jgi:hypothetical protein
LPDGIEVTETHVLDDFPEVSAGDAQPQKGEDVYDFDPMEDEIEDTRSPTPEPDEVPQGSLHRRFLRAVDDFKAYFGVLCNTDEKAGENVLKKFVELTSTFERVNVERARATAAKSGTGFAGGGGRKTGGGRGSSKRSKGRGEFHAKPRKRNKKRENGRTLQSLQSSDDDNSLFTEPAFNDSPIQDRRFSENRFNMRPRGVSTNKPTNTAGEGSDAAGEESDSSSDGRGIDSTFRSSESKVSKQQLQREKVIGKIVTHIKALLASSMRARQCTIEKNLEGNEVWKTAHAFLVSGGNVDLVKSCTLGSTLRACAQITQIAAEPTVTTHVARAVEQGIFREPQIRRWYANKYNVEVSLPGTKFNVRKGNLWDPRRFG